MEQRDDIWNRIIRHNLEYEPDIQRPSTFRPRGSANPVNKPWDIIVHERYFNFVSDYIDKKGLSWLYALDMELNKVIESIARYLFDDDVEPIPDKHIESIYLYLTKKYPKTKDVVDYQKLFPEIKQSKTNYHNNKQKSFDTPPEMQSLSLLQDHTQARIEYGNWNCLDKTRSLFEAQLIAFPNNINVEALIRLLIDTKKSYKEPINCMITKWEEHFHNDKIPSGEISFQELGNFTKALRLTQWANINNDINTWKKIAESVQLLTPDEILSKYPSLYHRLFWAQFNIFKSDFALELLDKKLEVLLFQLQEWLKKILINKTSVHYDVDNYSQPALISTIASTYVFGSYRLSSRMVDPHIVEDATQYLLFQKKPYEIWLDHNNEFQSSYAGVSLTAMIIHALCLAEPHGLGNFLKDALCWLTLQQTLYGEWYDVYTAPPLEISAFVLDTIALVTKNQRTTFYVADTKELKTKYTEIIEKPQLPKTTIPPEGKETSDEKLLDDINVALIRIYQEAEQRAEITKKVHLPTQEQMAQALYNSDTTKKLLSKQAISKRLKRLRQEKLIGIFKGMPEHPLPYTSDRDDINIERKW